MAQTFADELSIEQLGPSEFVSRICPGHYGNPGGIAYGGATLAIATRAACATAPEGYSLYSLMGHFLGPASTKLKLLVSVENTRDTRTFATRRVVVKQEQPDGKTRSCLELLADFHVEEPALVAYSAPPALKYKGPDESPTMPDLVGKALEKGTIKEDPTAVDGAFYLGLGMHFDMRTCAEGMSGQNLGGMLKDHPTDQDGLHVADRASGDWTKLRVPLKSYGEKTASLAFLMDSGLAFAALGHNHLWFTDCGPCLTIDFALRLFVPEVNPSNWHLRETKTIAAGHGRTYSESRLWDEQGTLVVSMTQQCILRLKPETKVKASL